MEKEEILKELEKMPTGLTSRIKIGENERGLKFVRIDNPKATMEELKRYNIESDGFEIGFKSAVDKFVEWRNDLYLRINNLKN